MTEFLARWLGIGSNTGLAARCVSVVGWMLAAFLPVALIGNSLYGEAGVWAAAVAALCCLAGAVPPLLATQFLRKAEQALPLMLIGMFSRMSIPLALGLFVQVQQGVLSRSGFMIDLVVFFCVGLTFETLSLLSVVAAHSPGKTRSLANPS